MSVVSRSTIHAARTVLLLTTLTPNVPRLHSIPYRPTPLQSLRLYISAEGSNSKGEDEASSGTIASTSSSSSSSAPPPLPSSSSTTISLVQELTETIDALTEEIKVLSQFLFLLSSAHCLSFK